MKEAMYISQGSASSVMQLSAADQALLWESLHTCGDLEAYTKAIRSLPKPQPNKDRRVALRIYFVHFDTTSEVEPIEDHHRTGHDIAHRTRRRVDSWEQVVCTSRPMSTACLDENGETKGMTLGEAVRRVLEPRDRDASVEYSVTADANRPLEDLAELMEVWVQGVQMPLDAPLGWLCDELHHPDRFLYICVHHKSIVKQ